MQDLVLNYPRYLKIEDNKKEFKYNYYQKYLIDNATLTDTTIKGYSTCLKQFNKWLKSMDIHDPTNADLKNYVLYLKNTNYTTGTKNQYIRAVKHLFKWLSSEGLYDDITKGVKEFRDPIILKKDAFTEQDIQKIINDIDTTTPTGKRDKAILLLIITGGLRINEVINIDIQDITSVNNQYRVYIKGKGHAEKDTYIKIIEQVYDSINDYLKTRQNASKREPLFISVSNRTQKKQERLKKESLSRILKTRFKESGYDSKRLTAHSLRHSTATILLKSGADLYTTQQHLRHLDPKTTERYINLNNKEQATNEQDIYNKIFNADKQDLINDIKKELNNLTINELKDIKEQITYIKEVK